MTGLRCRSSRMIIVLAPALRRLPAPLGPHADACLRCQSTRSRVLRVRRAMRAEADVRLAAPASVMTAVMAALDPVDSARRVRPPVWAVGASVASVAGALAVLVFRRRIVG